MFPKVAIEALRHCAFSHVGFQRACYLHALSRASIPFVQDGGSPVVEYEAGVLETRIMSSVIYVYLYWSSQTFACWCCEVRVALSGDLTILAQLCVEGREVKLAGDLLRR